MIHDLIFGLTKDFALFIDVLEWNANFSFIQINNDCRISKLYDLWILSKKFVKIHDILEPAFYLRRQLEVF